MATLLRADLRRLTRPHGSFLLYLAVFLALVLLVVIGTPLLTKAIAGMNLDGEKVEAFSGYSSPMNLFASFMLFGWVSLITSWCMTSVCWAEMRAGFSRTMASSCGKKTYYTEKLLLALVLSAAFVVIGMVVAFLGGMVMGLNAFSPIVDVLVWAVLTIVECWGCACLTLAALWLFKNSTVAFAVALTLGTGLVSGVVSMSVASIPGVADAWAELAGWLPVSAFSYLQAFDNGSFAPDLTSLAHILVPAVVCVAASYAVALTALPKRDM